MNITVKNIFFALGATAIMASCGENSWNDHLDGFEPGVNYNTAIEGEFTMSAADYNAVASNATNKSLAEAANAANALKAVGNNGMFSAAIPAKEYLPAYLASSSAPYFLAPEGSKINVTYQETGETDPIIAQIAGAASYTVTTADYQAAWKSEEDYIDAFAPMTPASEKLHAILKAGIADAEAGQYAVVNYDEATDNPVFVQLGGNDKPLTTIYGETFTENQGAFVIYNAEKPDDIESVWTWGGANYGMKASGFKKPNNYDTSAWLISPAITLGGEKANFSFDQATNFFTDIETAKREATVWVRVSGGNWEQITDYEFPTTMSWTFVNSGEIDLSKYCGSTIQIAFKYTSTAAKAGTWEVMNFTVNAQEGSVGANPGFGAPALNKVLANTPVIASKTAVYTYDGSKWTVASDAVALSAADYTAMGFANNKLESPDTYLPLFLKANKPYAVEGDMTAVVYNGKSCSVCVYDGQNWTVNNNNLQTLVGQFEKKDGKWSFVKYIGKSYFNLTTELILDRPYLIVADGICAIPQAASKNYGYLYTAPVEISDGVIEQKNEVNAFTFSSTVEVDGKLYKLPEGQFLIIDSNNRYLYMSGSFDSFNFAAAPKAADGAIDAAYVFKAEHNGDGVWTIRNVGNDKWIQYSANYSSFGCYSSEKGVLPSLYVLAAE